MKKKNIIVVILLFVLVMAAGILEWRGPQFDEACIGDIIDKARQKYDIPAISVSVVEAEQIRFTVFDGVRTYGTEDTITGNDFFHIGSCAKAVLAYITAKLVEEGSVNWDTRFLDIYPEMKDDAREAYAGITLEELLACRAGIQPYTSGMEEYPDLSASQDKELDFIRYLLAQPPAANQSASAEFDFLYSNASYTLAAAMLERISGLTYEGLLHKYIVQGLGLDVFIGWPYEKDRTQPRGHLQGLDHTLTIIGPGSVYRLNPLITPAGNLSMKSEDFAKFVQLHLQGVTGAGTQLQRETFGYMDTKYCEFSLGVWNGRRVGQPYICLEGTAGTFYARGVLIPDSDLGFTVMMNCGSEEAVEYITMKLMKARYNWWWMFWI